MFSLPLDMFPEVELSDRMVVVCLISRGSSMPFFIMAVPIYNPASSAQGLPFLCILANNCYLIFFYDMAILTGVMFYFIVVLI